MFYHCLFGLTVDGLLTAGRIEAVSCPNTPPLDKRTAQSQKPRCPADSKPLLYAVV